MNGLIEMEEKFFDAVTHQESGHNETSEEHFHDTLSDLPDTEETVTQSSEVKHSNNSCDVPHHSEQPSSSTSDSPPMPPRKSIKQMKAELREKKEEEENTLSEERLQVLFEEAQTKKAEGNEKYGKSEIDDAISLYTEALELCPMRHKKERAILFSNRAACYARQSEHEKAIEDCDDALELHPTYMKCLLRRAEQRRAAEKLQDALEDYQKILEMDPGNGAARMACMTLPEEIKVQQEKLKEEMFGQLKQLGNLVLKPFGLSTENFKMVQDPNSGGYSINFVK